MSDALLGSFQLLKEAEGRGQEAEGS